MKNRSRSLVLLTALLMGLLLSASAFAIPNGACVVSKINGVIQISPPGCSYDGPGDLVHGEGTEYIQWDPTHAEFTNTQTHPGGLLNGNIEVFESVITIDLTGIGELEGYSHTVRIPAHCETHTAPWDPKGDIISFATEMVRIEGELREDSDFESLKIVAGTENGYPSPGHTTATTQDGRNYVVDSMFNVGFRIDYVGAQGGPLDGLAGSFEGKAVMKAYATPKEK